MWITWKIELARCLSSDNKFRMFRLYFLGSIQCNLFARLWDNIEFSKLREGYEEFISLHKVLWTLIAVSWEVFSVQSLLTFFASLIVRI